MIKFLQLTFLIFILAPKFNAVAQEESDQSSRIHYKPKAILVMLHLSTTLIKSYERQNDLDGIHQVEKNDEMTNNYVMQDFAGDFDYCPVYYFYDTEHEKATKHQFSQMHFFTFKDNHKTDIDLPDSLSDYYFADLNYAPITYQVDITTSTENFNRLGGDEGFVSTASMGLNLYFPDFKSVTARFGRVKCFRKTISEISNPYAASGRMQKAINRRFRDSE